MVGTWKQLPINASDSHNPTPPIVKCGRFKCSYEFNLNLNYPATPKNPANYMSQAVLIYVPQGWNITTTGTVYQQAVQRAQIIENLMYSHPEWVIARRQVSTPQVNTAAQSNYFFGDIEYLSSKLKRNLNSGDFIMFGFYTKCIVEQAGETPFGINVNGICEYKTCSN